MREDAAPCSLLLQNTLYLCMGKSETGGSHLSTPHSVPFTLISDPTASFNGGPGAFGAVESVSDKVKKIICTWHIKKASFRV